MRQPDSSVLNFDHILSPAVRVDNLLFLSGQTPRDSSGEVIKGTIEEMTEYVW
jgi:enamine deaminase RidA (YjgF/YER057c/UK114 family)